MLKTIWRWSTVYRCKTCEVVVTNPICESCLTREFDAWLGEFSPFLEFRFASDCLPRVAGGEAAGSCILCGEPLDVCPFCTTKNFIDWLRSMGVHRHAIHRAKRTFATSSDRKFLWFFFLSLFSIRNTSKNLFFHHNLSKLRISTGNEGVKTPH